jgi:hypothetical protein
MIGQQIVDAERGAMVAGLSWIAMAAVGPVLVAALTPLVALPGLAGLQDGRVHGILLGGSLSSTARTETIAAVQAIADRNIVEYKLLEPEEEAG